MTLSDVFSDRMTWRRLTALIEHMPYQHATRRAMGDDTGVWGLNELLLAATVDSLRIANWQRSGKGSRPKPIPRPGVRHQESSKHHHGNVDPNVPAEQIADYFASFAPPTEEAHADGG